MNNLLQVEDDSRNALTARQYLDQRIDEFRVDRWQNEWRGQHIMRGRSPGASSVRLISNDYLSIAGHPEIVSAQIDALKATSESVLMSGVFLHGQTPQKQLECRFADWAGMPEAILSQSGYAANVGLLQAISGPGVPVYIDMHAHASLWDGIQSAGAEAHPWRHNDISHLRRQITAHGPGVVCVDSVYSTNGSVCKLAETVGMAKLMGCLVIVDESHSLGTHGPSGAGMVAGQGLTGDVDFITASLAKAFAGRAGLIMCPVGFSDYFWFTARPAIFSSCLLPHEISALDKTLDVVIRDEWRRESLHKNADIVRRGLADLGYNVDASKSQIIALESGLEYDTLCLRQAMEANDIFGSVFCAPATPKKRSLLRLSINASMSMNEIGKLLKACEDVRDQVGMWEWSSTRRKSASGQTTMLRTIC
ncbi:alpha-hydroxyketone-type quorum-sensing autoinducer synthase [Alcanivorax sp. 1008]|uniref:alpha-hydroxyketone-type quorum-sensing autoinducer synthase n=1 Tax=Alcanivorax sp. 1008 TaxID=2816853 RepID=UPI001E05143D|nr:alpha-hydroxyketone-type quorum-sensing autoinducer synthase [Alcanivorax sp. 1008]MCC1497041.1 quorum-sensing autoinducer CAI-1 synthase [Alcanivorax sp. 1008]